MNNFIGIFCALSLAFYAVSIAIGGIGWLKDNPHKLSEEVVVIFAKGALDLITAVWIIANVLA